MENKKKIVIFSCFYEPFMSGAERFVKEVVERLKNEHRFFVISAKLRADLPEKEDMGGYDLIRIGNGDKWDKIRYIWLAPRKAKELDPDILHAVMESYAGLALCIAKYIVKGAKRILTLQSGDLDAKIWSRVPILWKKIHKSPDKITAISNFLAKRAERLGAKDIEVVPNGFDFTQVAQVFKTTDSVKRKVICIARLSWEKDHKNLILAMPNILNKYPDAELILIGDGPLKEDIKSQIKDLGLENKIILKGNLSHSKAMEELSRADLFICPSLAEGLGIVFIEAQAIGIPVIGTRVGGIPDVIEDGKTGLLIEPNSAEQITQAIIKVFEMSEEQKSKMIEDAKKSAREKFQWDNIADKIDIIYKENKKPSILIATGIYPPDIGGPATYSKLIAKKLKERDYQIFVLTYSDKRIINKELEIINVSRKLPAGLRHLAYFFKMLWRGRKADIIYVQDSVSAGLPVALANLFLRKKLVLKVVGDYAWEQAMQVESEKLKVKNLDNFYPLDKSLSAKIKLLEKIQNWVARHADKIVTPSYYLKDILTKGWEIKSDKITVIYNSFNVRQRTTDNGQRQPSVIISEEESIPSVIPHEPGGRDAGSHRFKILSVGRLVPWKGLDALIEVMQDIPNAELEIIGDGPEKERLELKIKKSKLENRIKLSGRLSHDEVVQKMCSSDLFILNSAYEGLSHVILEAMACELPVAASRAGGNAELIGKSQERGFLFEYNNNNQIKSIIKSIINYRFFAQEKSKKAKEFVFGFSQEKMIDVLEQELKK